MTYESKIKAVAAGVTVTLFASLLTIGVMTRNNSLLSEDLKAEKVRTESLAGEKSNLKKEMEKLRKELSSFDFKNKELEGAIKKAQYQLAEKESHIARLTKENGGIAALRKELDAIRKIRKDLIAELEGMKKSNTQLEAEVMELSRTIAALRRENESLQNRISEKPIMAYNFRIEAVKKRKDKLSVKARKVEKVHISFDVNSPKDLGGEVYVKLRSDKAGDLQGQTLLAYEEAVQPEDEQLWASSEASIIVPEEFKRFNVAFDPKDKMAEGVYHVMVYSGNHYLGSTQFRLRK